MTEPTAEIHETICAKNREGWSVKPEADALCNIVERHYRAFEKLRAMLGLGAFGEDSGSTLFSHQAMAEMTAVIDAELTPIVLPDPISPRFARKRAL